ncbi:MAG: STAS domain-containing protein [Planctomycetes bacterium]|nr:STAS domain-containing protein [Planctomycetota bacterium]
MVTIADESFDLALVPNGDLSANSVGTERERFLQEMDVPDLASVLVDLRATNTIDSQGISLVVGIYKECTKKDLACTVAISSALIYKVFQMMQLDKHIRLLRTQ